jgi:hypothetical protein
MLNKANKMKKNITLLFGFVCITLMSSFMTTKNEVVNYNNPPEENCDELAMSNYYLDLAYGSDSEVAALVYLYTLHDCMENGGYSDYEITVELN